MRFTRQSSAAERRERRQTRESAPGPMYNDIRQSCTNNVGIPCRAFPRGDSLSGRRSLLASRFILHPVLRSPTHVYGKAAIAAGRLVGGGAAGGVQSGAAAERPKPADDERTGWEETLTVTFSLPRRNVCALCVCACAALCGRRRSPRIDLLLKKKDEKRPPRRRFSTALKARKKRGRNGAVCSRGHGTMCSPSPLSSSRSSPACFFNAPQALLTVRRRCAFHITPRAARKLTGPGSETMGEKEGNFCCNCKRHRRVPHGGRCPRPCALRRSSFSAAGVLACVTAWPRRIRRAAARCCSHFPAAPPTHSLSLSILPRLAAHRSPCAPLSAGRPTP